MVIVMRALRLTRFVVAVLLVAMPRAATAERTLTLEDAMALARGRRSEVAQADSTCAAPGSACCAPASSAPI